MVDQKEETRREREEARREIAWTDSTVGRLLAAIVAVAVVALLLLVFGERSGSPRIVEDGAPAPVPTEGEKVPAPTTPTPSAIPKVQ